MRQPCALRAGLLAVALTLGAGQAAQAAEDLFAAVGVQRPANAIPVPDLSLPSLDGATLHLKDLRGKVVLLGFFTTT